MTVLLDTHLFLWFVLGDVRLSSVAKSTIEDSHNTVVISPASHWEIAIKISVGKYRLNRSYEEFWQTATGATTTSPSFQSNSGTPAGSLRSPGIKRIRSIACWLLRRWSSRFR